MTSSEVSSLAILTRAAGAFRMAAQTERREYDQARREDIKRRELDRRRARERKARERGR